MNPLLRIARKIGNIFRRRSAEAEMQEEMRYHLEQRAAELEGDGLSAEEARYAAQRKFGNTASIEEQARDALGWRWLMDFARDLRLGVRSLLKSPGFSVLAIITLALGIGANTAMFGMIQTILFKPLPYPDGDQLIRLYRAIGQNRNGHIAPADFLDFRRAINGLGETAAYTPANASLSEPGSPAEMAYAGRITTNLLSVLGISPQLGRSFHLEEETPGQDRVVILSRRVWQRRYGGEPDIIDRTIRIDGEPHKVIGVMPDTFNDWRHLGMIDFFRPLAFSSEMAADRNGPLLRVVVRRSPARPFAEVEGFVADFGARLAKQFPDANAESSWRAAPLSGTITGKSARPMFNMMIALSGLVLLIACSNLANLLLARTMARAREFAVRGALGASRTQLLRPLVAESLLLALLGGLGAVVLAVWFRDYMAVRSMGDNGEGVVMDIGWPLFGWAFVASLVTAVAFGLAPALFALRLDLHSTLKSGGRGAAGGRGHRRFRHLLIVGQFALAMTLLAVAGVNIRGLQELNNRRVGWASEQLVTGSILLPAANYTDAEKIAAFQRLTLERLAALPGVASASVSSFTPFFTWPDARKFVVDGGDRPQPGKEPAAVVNSVSPGYFDVYGTLLLAGRAFDERDTAQSPKVFIVSELTARALFGSANPIGQRLAQIEDESPRWGEVVGVVADVEPAVTDLNLAPSQIYQPMAQEPRRLIEIAVRTTGIAPSILTESVRTTMAQLDPDLPVRRLQHADLTVERANYSAAIGRDIFSGMAVLGLGLAALGIYGVIARTMAQRSGEFAIRVALGASLANITRLVLASGVKLALFGSALGLLGGIGACRILVSLSPGMRTNSAEVLVGATLLLITVALVACWLPAKRASQINPVDALRAE